MCDRPNPPPPPPPIPPRPAPPPDTSEYWAVGNQIFTTAFGTPDTPLRIKGVSWFGMESSVCYIGGADSNPISTYMAFLKENSFNAIRVPLAADAILGRHNCMMDDGVYYTHNHDLMGLNYGEQLQQFVRYARDAGLLVLLDLHVAQAGKWPDGGTLGSGGLGTVKDAWARLAELFCEPADFWNVFAADLKNEPYGMSWGPPPPNAPAGMYSRGERWDTAAADIGTHVHARCSRWLLFVEGVGHCQQNGEGATANSCNWPSSAGQDTTFNTFWGEGLQGAQRYPVSVSDRRGRSKVVYSPHTYGPSVFEQPFFKEPSFPANMPDVWRLHYGHMAEQGAPVIIGEWGGKFQGKDREWQGAFANWLVSSAVIGSFYWCLNPESADTGGLLIQWRGIVPRQDKLELLSQFPSTPVPPDAERVYVVAVAPPPTPPPPPPPLPPPPPSPPLPSPPPHAKPPSPPPPPPAPRTPCPPPPSPVRSPKPTRVRLHHPKPPRPPSPPHPPPTESLSRIDNPEGIAAALGVAILVGCVAGGVLFCCWIDKFMRSGSPDELDDAEEEEVQRQLSQRQRAAAANNECRVVVKPGRARAPLRYAPIDKDCSVSSPVMRL